MRRATKQDFVDRLIEDGQQDIAVATLRLCMTKAEVALKGGGTMPDYSTRLKAAIQVLNYTQGLPARRFEIIQANIDATKIGAGAAGQEMEMTDATVEAMEEAIRSYKLTKYSKATGRHIKSSE